MRTTYSVIRQYGLWSVLEHDHSVAVFADKRSACRFVLAAVDRGCAQGRASKVLVYDDTQPGPELVFYPANQDLRESA